MSGYSFSVEIDGITFEFLTNQSVFSPKYADPGTLLMLEAAQPWIAPGAKVLDLGCGYGLAGIYAAKACHAGTVVMSDISAEACGLARLNAARNGLEPPPVVVQSDGFTNIDISGFDVILSNPPYHEDFSVPKMFIEKGFNRLLIGGRLFMVTKRFNWYKNKISAVFGGVKVTESGGYYVFEARRRGFSRSDSKNSKKP